MTLDQRCVSSFSSSRIGTEQDAIGLQVRVRELAVDMIGTRLAVSKSTGE